MSFSEKWGKDVDEAVELALKDLNLTREEVNIEVLEQPSKGFLGLGSKLAKVRVEEKAEDQVNEEPKKEVKKNINVKKEKDNNNVSLKNVDKEEGISNIFSRSSDLKEIENHPALDFLRDTTSKMNLELNFKAFENEENIYIDIEGKDAGTIIGKRGQTLDAIQYLTSLVVNKNKEDYKRVIVDAENYRIKREKTLQLLASRLSDKVIRTNRSVRLEPMNPYERMVIHATLQKNPKVKTRSEGEEPYRRVIIEIK